MKNTTTTKANKGENKGNKTSVKAQEVKAQEVKNAFDKFDFSEMLRVENKFKKASFTVEQLKERLASSVKTAQAKKDDDKTKTHVSYGFFLKRRGERMFYITYNEKRAKGYFWQYHEVKDSKVIFNSELFKEMNQTTDAIDKIKIETVKK